MGALVSSSTTRVHPFDYEPNRYWRRFWCCSISKSKSIAVQTHAYGLMFEKVDHVNQSFVNLLKNTLIFEIAHYLKITQNIAF